MTWHIHIQGQVQGVGFRPFVYNLAQRFALKGWVNNSSDGVHIQVNAEAQIVQAFFDELLASPPRLSRITKATIQKASPTDFATFTILHSKITGQVNLTLSPDFGLCESCRADLYDDHSRRKNYAFTSCVQCGPRYSISTGLPYDRSTTAMDEFALCTSCSEEYYDPSDRRYFAQTNSCLSCQIKLNLYDAGGTWCSSDQNAILSRIPQLWKEGKIVAIKGIGGYLLTCDASSEKAVSILRTRKQRPTKPFALLFPNLQQIQQVLEINDVEQEMLQSSVSPIVLARRKQNPALDVITELVAPGLNRLGAMLPYTPLYELLVQAFGRPIVATSANMSNSPIVFKDKIALTELTEIADYILSNEREIVMPQDDSVIQFSNQFKQPIILRRARGWAPAFIQSQLQWSIPDTLAMGAMLKSTFSILHQKNTYIGQYLGDLDHFDTQQHYRYSFEHLTNLLGAAPKMILCDTHPTYPSTQLGEEWSHQLQIPVQYIQHHEAHFGAILGEHDLLHHTEPILGVIWDGTGLGTDQQIWGGEFFHYHNYAFNRRRHFAYFKSLAGDKMAKEPRLSALSIGAASAEVQAVLKDRFTTQEWRVYQNRLNSEQGVNSTSMGRLFDAVAAILLGIDRQSYEGEAAIQLQALAETYYSRNGFTAQAYYDITVSEYEPVSSQEILHQVLVDFMASKDKESVAAKFHFTLVMIIKRIASQLKIRRIAFSGGVFQNGLLVDLLQYHLAEEFTLYFHQQLSPNDENISFGQLVCAEINWHRSLLTSKTQDHVFSNSR